MMNEQEIRTRKVEIEAQFGPWTAHNIPLAHGIATNPQRPGPHPLLRKAVQTISDLSTKPWNQLRILDLASLEGFFSLEFASHGAEVVAIEGRESNNAHARFAAEVLGFRNVEFITDDVRNLSPEKYGQFDVVFCSGILYHLTGADACRFVASIKQVCNRLTIINTHIGLRPDHAIHWEGHTYSGFVYREHGPKDTPEMKAGSKWASLDNETSFWFTKPSLLNLLRAVGFTSAFEILNPSGSVYSDRLTFAAISGKSQTVSMSPELALVREPEWPEHSSVSPHPAQATASSPWRRVAGRLGRAVGM